MLKASELRLGNLIASWENGLGGRPVHVTPRILKDLANVPPHVEFLMYKPIDLNIEVLEKSGFRNVTTEHEINQENKAVYEKGLLICVVQSKVLVKEKLTPLNPYLYFFYIKGLEGNLCFSKRYLHDLQNLYYALVGEELQVDL